MQIVTALHWVVQASCPWLIRNAWTYLQQKLFGLSAWALWLPHILIDFMWSLCDIYIKLHVYQSKYDFGVGLLEKWVLEDVLFSHYINMYSYLKERVALSLKKPSSLMLKKTKRFSWFPEPSTVPFFYS